MQNVKNKEGKMKINVEELRKTSRIAIVGHKNADFDCMVSGILLKYIL